MTMVSCNLYFDPAAEDAVRGLWQRLADAGLPAKSAAGYPPHITLTAYTSNDPAVTVMEFAARLVSVVERQQPIPVRLEALGVFPEAGVVFLAPHISRALLDLHRTVFERLSGPHMPELLEDLLLPDRWTPHVTLATHLDADQIARIVGARVRDGRSIQGEAVGLGLRILPDLVDAHRLGFVG